MRAGRLSVVVVAISWGLLSSPASAVAAECEISWWSDTTYIVADGGSVVEVVALAKPDLDDWGPSCGDLVLSFPVVPGVQDIEVDTPVEHRLDIQDSVDSDLSSLALLVFAAEGRELLRAGISVSYLLAADGDWMTVGEQSVQFPAWSVGEREGSSVTVVSGRDDVIVMSAPMAFGEPALGSTTYTFGGDPEWDAYAAVTFGSFERVALGEDIVYFVERDGSDPNARVIDAAADGFRAIEELLGPRPTLGKELNLIEVGERALRGYAGRYDASFELIQVDASLGQGTLLHEISHAWLNDDTFGDPWMSEGLADYVSGFVEDGLPNTDATPPINAEWVAPAETSLRDWEAEALDSSAAADRVEYGYAASLWVVDRVAEEVGKLELIRYVQSLVVASMNNGSPITSEQFLVGLEQDLGFTDKDGVFEEFVFGSTDAIAAARAAALPPAIDTTGTSGLPVSGMWLVLAAGTAALLLLVVTRSLRSRPLGQSAAFIDTDTLAVDDDWEIGRYTEETLVDSDWSF